MAKTVKAVVAPGHTLVITKGEGLDAERVSCKPGTEVTVDVDEVAGLRARGVIVNPNAKTADPEAGVQATQEEGPRISAG